MRRTFKAGRAGATWPVSRQISSYLNRGVQRAKAGLASSLLSAAVALCVPQPTQAETPVHRSMAREATDLATGFVEPLVATKPTTQKEDRELRRAVALYQ